MSKTNGRTEVEKRELDLDHELPAADGAENSAASGDSSPDSELQKTKAERDSLLDRLARMQAEFENARRRSLKEQQDSREYAAADTIKALLPILDSFDRAFQVKADPAEFRNGIDLIYKQLQTTLGKMSLQPVPAEGQTFDPHVHEAIEMVDTTDAPDHEVIEELQRGYKLKDRLLRPAMVKVARNPGK